ncbi:biotin--[acetyl-CoA-carboxylase] ligase [Acidiphilium sp.]|uniref:biotin--[acetyl-CoA-carboxylase] ligase n=1 Tax=Acidiphilium sp. TaxID=527 RepID=UPI003D01404E
MTAEPGWRFACHETLASTSDLCAERARNGEPDRLFVTATRQTAGRGRAGRVWSSPSGNFYASALLRPAIPAAEGGMFALIAGLSLLESLDPMLPHPSPLSLKWPNDLMANGAKLAGILLDATVEQGMIATLIIGFGVNLAHAPEIEGRATTSLAALGGRATPADLLPTLCARLDHWQASLAADHGATLRAAWQSRAHPQGAALTIDGGRRTGTFAGIDAAGSLLLRQGDTITTIRSGDVALL